MISLCQCFFEFGPQNKDISVISLTQSMAIKFNKVSRLLTAPLATDGRSEKIQTLNIHLARSPCRDTAWNPKAANGTVGNHVFQSFN